MKISFKWLSVFALIMGCLLTGCDKDKEDSASFKIQLSGTQQVPPVAAGGTGQLTGTYIYSSRRLDFKLNWNVAANDTVTMAHFHGPALPTENKPPLFTLFSNASGDLAKPSGAYQGSIVLSASQESDMLNGKWYVNVHTKKYPSGAIRGQITLTP